MPGKRLLTPLLVALCLMLMAAGIAYADLKAVSVFYGWDEKSNSYANGNNEVTFDGRWVSFLHELSFDKDPYVRTNPAYPQYACPLYPTRTTKWAGVMELGLYHVDNAPDGAQGWRESRAWKLVACDRDGDGDFDGKDREKLPMDDVLPYTGGTLTVITKDLSTACTTGNCKYEIVTTIFINTDSDCDGAQNTDIPAGGLCFYAEGRTPVVEIGSPLLWGGNIQARIGAGGGEKTVNFKVKGAPVGTAVTLASFTAKSAAHASVPVTLWAVAAVLGVLGPGVVIWRARSARAPTLAARQQYLRQRFGERPPAASPLEGTVPVMAEALTQSVAAKERTGDGPEDVEGFAAVERGHGDLDSGQT